MLCVCVGDVMDVVFSVCIVRRGTVGARVWGVCVFRHADVSTFVVTITRCFISEYFNFRMSWFFELIIRIRNLTSTKLKWLLHT